MYDNYPTFTERVIGLNDTFYDWFLRDTLALSREATHGWDVQYIKRKVPQGIIWYQEVCLKALFGIRQ